MRRSAKQLPKTDNPNGPFRMWYEPCEECNGTGVIVNSELEKSDVEYSTD